MEIKQQISAVITTIICIFYQHKVLIRCGASFHFTLHLSRFTLSKAYNTIAVRHQQHTPCTKSAEGGSNPSGGAPSRLGLMGKTAVKNKRCLVLFNQARLPASAGSRACDLQPATCNLPPAICHLPPTTYDLRPHMPLNILNFPPFIIRIFV